MRKELKIERARQAMKEFVRSLEIEQPEEPG